MASRGSGTPLPPTTPTITLTGTPIPSHLSRKKKEIVERSMAFFRHSLDRCLDHSVAAAASGAGGVQVPPARRAKRARERDEDGVVGGSIGVGGQGEEEGGAGQEGGAGAVRAVRKKRVKRDGSGRKFACPFCKHDPGRYRNVKTCCGPGWEDVHRVKEHVYRSHSLKNFCPRCFERFDKPEALKIHQRAEVPCKLKAKGPDVITEEQEKLLRARAKMHCSEEVKWEEMYRAIFPGEDTVPSPYYDSDAEASPKADKSRFKSMDECREFIRKQLPLLVQPILERYVDELLEDIQAKMNKKSAEILRDVETKLFLTFHFQDEQQAAGPVLEQASSEASPEAESSNIAQMFADLRNDPVYAEYCETLEFNVDDILASTQQGLVCDNFSVDSAYYTASSHGDSFAGGAGYGTGPAGYLS